MKILLLGGTGLLGSAFKKVLTDSAHILFSPARAELDILDETSLLEYTEEHSPDLVINCVAYTNVDLAETERDKSYLLNAKAIEHLVSLQIPLINFSTDYVFDYGLETGEISENYKRTGVNYYGKTKLEGERVLETSEINFWNIRTSWLFGPGGKNFVSTILKSSETRDELKVVADQYGRPTYAPDLAQFVAENFIEKEEVPCGHYHLQNTGPRVSWAEFAEHFLKLKNWPGTLIQISTSQYPTAAKRPQNSVLANTKLESEMRDWREAVADYLGID